MVTRVVVLGAGFGGLELATAVSTAGGADVELTLIDKSDGFVFGFSKLDVMFGRLPADQVVHRYAGLTRPGVRFVAATITAIDPVERTVQTDAGSFSADILVVALGADLHPEATPGLVEGGQEFYSVAGAFAARRSWTGSPAAGSSSGSRPRRSSARRLRARPPCSCTSSSRSGGCATAPRSAW